MAVTNMPGVNPGATVSYYKNSIQSEEELKENNLRIDNDIVARASKLLPATSINLINAATKIGVTAKEVGDVIKHSAPAAAIASEALTAMTALGSVAGITNKAKQQNESNNYLKNATNNIYGGVTSSGMGVNLGLLNNAHNNVKGISSTVATASMLNDLMNGSFVNGNGMSATTKVALGMANPALGLINLLGGFGSVGGAVNNNVINPIGNGIVNTGLQATGVGKLMGIDHAVNLSTAQGSMLASGLDFATGMGSFMLINKALSSISNAIKEMDPNSAKSAKKLKLATNYGVKHYATEDSMEASEHIRNLSFIKTLGPNGMGALTVAETMQLSMLSGIKYNTSFNPIMTNLIQDLIAQIQPNTNRGNSVINSAQSEFGVQDHTGKEFNSLLRNGNPDALTKMLLGINNYTNMLSTLNPATLLTSLFNSRDINENAWSLRDAKLMGDKAAADKKVAQRFGISLSDMNVVTANLESWIGNQEDKQLALLYYQTKLARISTEKLINIAKNMPSSGNNESIGGARERENAQQQLDAINPDKGYNYLIDGILRSVDDMVRQTPVLKVLSPIAHLLTQTTKGVMGLTDGLMNPSKITGYFGNMFNDMKESFISKYMDPTLKNENDVRNAINAQEVSLEERFYSYMVNVFPTEFKKLLQAVGVKNASEVVSDKYSTDWVSTSELRERNQSRIDSLNALMENILPAEDSVSGWLKDKLGKKLFKINNMEDSVKDVAEKHFGYIDNIRDSLNGINTDSLNLDELNQTEKRNKFQEQIKNKQYFLEDNKMVSDVDYSSILKPLNNIDANLASLLDCCKAQSQFFQNKLVNLFNTKSNPEDMLKITSPVINNKSFSVEDIIRQNEAEDRKEKQYYAIYHNLPFLEKIYDLLDRKLKPTSVIKKPEEEIKNEEEGGLLDGIFDSIGGWFGFGDGDGNGKKGKKGKGKIKPKGGWFSKILDGIKNFAKFVMTPGKGRLIGLLTRLPMLGPLFTNPYTAIAGTVIAAGSIAYVLSDDLQELVGKAFDWVWDKGAKAFDWIGEKIDWMYSKFKSFLEFIGLKDPEKDKRKELEEENRRINISKIDSIVNNKDLSINEKLNGLDNYNKNTTQGYTQESIDYANLKRKELAESLNDESYKNYGIDINSTDMFNNKDVIKNLSMDALVKLQKDFSNLNKAENNIGPEEQKMRNSIQEEISKQMAEASKEISTMAKLTDAKEKEDFKKSHARIDSLAEALKDFTSTIDPTKSNEKLLDGLAQININTLSGITAVAQSVHDVAATANATSIKLIENSTNKIDFILNNKIVDILPGLSSLGSKPAGTNFTL